MAAPDGIQVAWTHEEIGQIIAMSRETVTRTLAGFRKQHIAEPSSLDPLIRNAARPLIFGQLGHSCLAFRYRRNSRGGDSCTAGQFFRAAGDAATQLTTPESLISVEVPSPQHKAERPNRTLRCATCGIRRPHFASAPFIIPPSRSRARYCRTPWKSLFATTRMGDRPGIYLFGHTPKIALEGRGRASVAAWTARGR